MIEEARLESVDSGLTPVTPGWFVVNAGEAAWMNNDRTQACCIFESDDFVLGGPGNRDLNEETFWRVYKRSDVAFRYGASVDEDTSSGAEANAPWGDRWRVERPESWSELPWSRFEL